MSRYGSCECKNIEIYWEVENLTLTPRACQCGYCMSMGAAYISKSGSTFEANIRTDACYHKVQHGSRNAIFHECTNCHIVVFVTAEMDGTVYGVLNANCLVNQAGLSTPITTNFGTESGAQKQQRWRQNWCQPVLITSRG